MPFTPDQQSSFKPDPAPSSAMSKPSAENAIKLGGVNPQGDMANVMRLTGSQTETPTGTQQLATSLIPSAAGVASKGLGALDRIGLAGLSGGTTAVGMQDPSASYGNKLETFLKGGALGSVLQGAGEASGKLGDYLMQRSTGMRKYTPGVGTNLAEQGLVGTRNRMTGQVSDKLPKVEQEVQDLVSGLEGSVDPSTLAEAIRAKGTRFELPSGEVPPNVQPYMNKVQEAASGVENLGGGQISYPDLLKLKRQGDWLGYTNSGTPGTALEAEIGRAQADKARSLLSEASKGETAKALGKEQALLLAKKSLTKPETIHQGMASMGLFGKIPGSSLVESAGGQAAVKGSNALKSPELQRTLLQSLFNNGTDSSQ